LLTSSNGVEKKETRKKSLVTFMQDLPDVTHTRTMRTESITQQSGLQQDGDAQTLTPGRTEVL